MRSRLFWSSRQSDVVNALQERRLIVAPISSLIGLKKIKPILLRARQPTSGYLPELILMLLIVGPMFVYALVGWLQPFWSPYLPSWASYSLFSTNFDFFGQG